MKAESPWAGSAAVAREGAAAATLRRVELAAPIAALVEIGVLDEIGAGYARADDISRAHPVWRVRLGDGRRLVVKAGIGHGGPDLAVECLVYRMTWWCRPLAAALPTPLVVDEDRQLLVLADVGPADGRGSLAQQVGFPHLSSGGPMHSTAPPVDPSVTRALGTTVGALHRATAGLPLPPAPPPLVLGLVGGPGEAAQASAPAPAIRAMLATLGSQPVIVDAVGELRRPVAGCLVNHDLKWDNVVLTWAGGQPQPALVDWELAGSGDPAWDVGCLLAEHLVRSRPHATSLDAGARALLAGYREGARPSSPVVPMLARRIVLAAGLRIAQLALEVAYTPDSGDSSTIAGLTEQAIRTLTAVEQLTTEVTACL